VSTCSKQHCYSITSSARVALALRLRRNIADVEAEFTLVAPVEPAREAAE